MNADHARAEPDRQYVLPQRRPMILAGAFLFFSALAIGSAGLTFAADLPGAGPVAIDTASLDKLQDQPVDIAPWTYAWRADRAVQQEPEACIIPRRLARIDTVYRPALTQVGAAALKSEHYDMPDLITP